MEALFGVSTPKAPAMPPPPKQVDEAVSNAAEAERIRRLMAYGKDSTLLTPTDTGQAPVQRKTLLGGG